MAEPITAPVTFNIFGKAVRQPGTYTTASVTIPAGVYGIGIKDTMTVADASDPATTFTITTFVSPDGLTWKAIRREGFTGGTHFNRFTGQTEPNRINSAWAEPELQRGEWVGWVVRVELDQPIRLSVGFDITAYPPGFNPE